MKSKARSGPAARAIRISQAGSTALARPGRSLGKRILDNWQLYALLLIATVFLFRLVPPGFVPQQDKQYLIGIAQLPDGFVREKLEKFTK